MFKMQSKNVKITMKQGVLFAAVTCTALVIIIYVLLCTTEVIDGDGNRKRHLSNVFDYAHFSRITKSNVMFNPQLLWAHPVHVTLTAGEAIMIPPAWWHWIRSDAHTYAVNFWVAETHAHDLPVLKKMTNAMPNHKELLETIQGYRGPVRVWDSYQDVFAEPVAADFNDKRNQPGKYIISLKGFESTGTVSANADLLAAIHPHIVTPLALQAVAKSAVEKNVWISLGKHDTGLHRDDSYGMLVVLQGTKRITLYPPSDTPLLKPYSVVPKWAEVSWPCSFSPNLYTIHKIHVTRTGFPASRLLYESMACRPNKSTLLKVVSLLHAVIDSPTVWGCKLLADGTMRWEVYAYHFDFINADNPNTAESHALLLDSHPHATGAVHHPDTLIHSYDIVGDATTLAAAFNGDVHVYRRLPLTKVTLPVFGEGLAVSRNGASRPESTYVIATRLQFAAHYHEYMTRLGFGAEIVESCKSLVLERYAACTGLCVFNKLDGNVFVMYLGISTPEFVAFLKDFGYPRQLQEHVGVHARQYDAVPHEITIVFDGKTKAPVRSAFYGILTPALF